MSAEGVQAGASQDVGDVTEAFAKANVNGDAPPKTEEEYAEAQLTLRAIVSSREAGVIIGKAGQNVADLRDKTGVRAGVSKVVQGVHDRVLTVTGALDGISQAYDFNDAPPTYNRRSGSDAVNRPPPPTTTEDGEEIQTQNISIPADMVGCIIGRGGSKISEIRKSSGARISIAKAPHDESGERMFTITGSAGANEKALYLLYENLEAEKMRRSQAPQE
ncbi:RNA binding protein, heterogenous nuclear RNP-K like protein [Cryomyces antarcticus]|uniref:RNA binding protein, heterogenous nuclear RNP-K like protein n=1 Tax=Cryomyces antarcticus TaxID=329879 RepID=A0ABR0KTX6_9PEZI|nr:RNA binding protein, heterogenous nuclear RNP-K like protein [Cryomyces antarcticus]